VLKDGASAPVRQLSKYVGETTNNVAEYLALLYALQEALQQGYVVVRVKTDSELLARQINGQYKVRDPQLRLLHDLAVHLRQGFREFTIEHIPRAQNAQADRLAGQAVTSQIFDK
jgi:ribonuclease HI